MSDPAFDARLRVELDDECPGPHYILGNGQTFTGRIQAWCPVKRRAFNFSVSEIEGASPEAVFWLRGFLAGNEPVPPDWADALTDPPGENANRTKYEAALARWREAVGLFGDTGYWAAGERSCDACGHALLPSWPPDLCRDCGGRLEHRPWNDLRTGDH